ncbi:MAG TPA: ABC-2 family transporter protein, partial [Chloroflexota bacterium]|nr:ABC-2 family transporter protein [Chloroflexota bacterium]
AYYLTFLAVDHATRTENHHHVGVKIHDGSMAALLLRPIPAVYEAIASDLASKIVGSLTIIPFLIGLALLLRPEVAIALDRFLLFIPSVALAWALAFSWTYWLSLTAFWLTHVSGIFRLHHAMMFVFGGQVAPLPVLPGALAMVAQVFPYRYMAAFPVEILIGQVNGPSLAVGFAWQLGWVIVSVALSVLLWRQGVRQYAAVGA